MREVNYQDAPELLEHLPDGVRLFTIFDNHVRWARFSPADMKTLGDAMAGIEMDGAVSALAGYTYLGQFLAHDISRLRMGSHSLMVDSPKEQKLYNSDVTAALDLSCIYDGADSESAMRLKGTAYMALGCARRADGSLLYGYDLPRKRENCRAYAGDDRNDENLIVSQLHLQYLHLHNFFVDKIQPEQPHLAREDLFKAARKQVVLHYQDVILYDFLYEILHPSVWKSIILEDQNILWNPAPGEEMFLPIEFAAAAGRFGHAMVRERYDVNKITNVETSELFRMTGFDRFGGNFNNLPTTHLIDWLLYFDFPQAEVTRAAREKLNHSHRISPGVQITLKHTSTLSDPDEKNLAVRNLIRGSRMWLGCGQDAVKYMQTCYSAQLQSCGITIRPLSSDELNLNKPGRLPKNVLHKINPELCDRTPLWFYLLAEAACGETVDGIGKLGPLGSLIVAESIKGLLKLDEQSVFHSNERRTDITPTKQVGKHAPGRRFLQMSDLILAVNPKLPDPTQL